MVFLIVVFFGYSLARDLIASVANIPVLAETPEKGLFIDFIKAMDEVYTEGKIIIQLYPAPRALRQVIKGEADFQIPMISDPSVNMDTMPFRFASLPMGTVCIVLYTNVAKEVTKESILAAVNTKPFPYKIELSGGSEQYYKFPTNPTADIATSFQKLERGRIDGYITAQEDGDIMCKKFRLKNVKRTLWECKDDVISIPNGPRGEEVDRIITDCIKKLTENGTLQKIRAKIHIPYEDWQPYKTTY